MKDTRRSPMGSCGVGGPRRLTGRTAFLLTALVLGALDPAPAAAVTVSGEISEEESPETPIEGARVTLFRPNLSFFREARTGVSGAFTIPSVPEGTTLWVPRLRGSGTSSSRSK